jgi:hypothetical protein
VPQIEPIPHVPAESDEDSAAQPTAVAPEGGEGDGLRQVTPGQEISAAEYETSRQWIRVAFARRGLAFMLDHPGTAIRDETGKLAVALIGWTILAVIGSVIFFLSNIWNTAWMVGKTDKITHHVNTWHEILIGSGFFALLTVAVIALILIVPVVRETVLEWSRVGNSMAVMLGFVALSFFSADSWHVAGAIPWWRLVTLTVVFSLLAFLVLYRQAGKAIDDVLKAPISTTGTAKDPGLKKMLADGVVLAAHPHIPQRALVNLRFISAILFARRIFISGTIVSAALFALGIIVIDQQDTFNLMNSHSATVIGFTGTFGIGSYKFFLSESLLKVSLLLGLIAAAYFVFANPDQEQSQDLQVPKFIRKIIVLWACYQSAATTLRTPEPDASGRGVGLAAGELRAG